MKATMAGVVLLLTPFLFPVQTGSPRFIQLTTPLSVSAEKTHPPYIAFAEVERLHVADEWDQMNRRSGETLTTVQAVEVPAQDAPIQLAHEKVVKLETMHIAKPQAEMASWVAETSDWMDNLPRRQRVRLSEAQRRFDILNKAGQESEEDLDTQIKQFIEQSRIQSDQEAQEKNKGIVVGSGTDANGDVKVPERSTAQISWNGDASFLDLDGTFQIAGGLALTGQDGVTFEIRRRAEGVLQEQGQLDPKEGTYKIRLKDRTGEVVARMKNREGVVIGEGSFRLASYHQKRGSQKGPGLTLHPRMDVAGRFMPSYKTSNSQRIAGLKANALSGLVGVETETNGEFELARIQRGSITLMSAEAQSYSRTLALVPSGFRSDLPLFPKSMIDSLKKIVSEQRQMSLDNPDSPVIWGRVSLDGKPLAGVQVEVESASGLAPVYFNDFFLPDTGLKSTTSNGLYAFVGLDPGFHSLLAKRSDAYFSHLNVVVEAGAVSVGDISSSLKTDQDTLRVFDAFTGEGRPALLIHQAVEEEIQIDEKGLAVYVLPTQHRLSVVRVQPEAPYAPAAYFVDDAETYEHFPLIRSDWLNYLRTQLRMNDVPNSGTVVGFVPDEDFKVESPTDGKIIYFDSMGRPAEKAGPGGGFILFDLPAGVREIVIQGVQSKMLSTRVVPVDHGSLSVLTYRSE